MPIASGAHGWSEEYRKRPRKEYVKPVREDTPTRYSKYIAKKNRQRAKDDPPPPRQMSPYEVAPVLEPDRPARKEQKKRDPDLSPEQPPTKKSEPAKPEPDRSPRKPQNNVPQKETKILPKKSKPLMPILMTDAPQQKSEFGPTAEPDVQFLAADMFHFKFHAL